MPDVGGSCELKHITQCDLKSVMLDDGFLLSVMWNNTAVCIRINLWKFVVRYVAINK